MDFDAIQEGGAFGVDRDFLDRLYGGFGAKPARGDFSFGIEEEYFVVRRGTGKVVARAPESLFAKAEQATEGRITREFLQSQIEVATQPFTHFDEARAELIYIRKILALLAAEHDMSILACGTHPTARWKDSVQTDKAHYDDVMDELQMIGRRNMLCGMHVHVQVPDVNRRVELMCRMIPYLPLLLALSTSSPFWGTERTGLKGYRLAAYDELPRTGLPELFRSAADYDAYVSSLVAADVIKSAGSIWWMIRPSLNHPTLELRAPDCCTRLEDALAVAALYRCLVRRLYLDPAIHADIDTIARAIAVENKWRAQRHGVRGDFVGARGAVSVADVLDDVIALTAEDARALDCEREIAHCREIVRGGASADEQIRVYEAALSDHAASGGAEGAERTAAGHAAVLAWLAEQSVPA